VKKMKGYETIKEELETINTEDKMEEFQDK
jgi:hypothetical protein